MPKRSVIKNSLRFRLSLMAAVLVFGSVPLVAPEAWWGRGAQGDCANTQPKGASWLNWSGYAPWSWGQSVHALSWRDPNTGIWHRNAQADTGWVYGATNTALASSSAGYRVGQWSVTAQYFASFPGLSSQPYFYDFYC